MAEREQPRRRERQSPPGATAERVAGHPGIAVHRVQGAPAAQVEQGGRRGQAAGEDPSEERERQRLRLHDGARAERERLRKIARGLVKDAPREHIPTEQPKERGGKAEAERLEEHHLHDRRSLGSDQAQVGDRAAPLGHGQQQRVEREQQAQQRGDRGEERARLVAGRQRLAQRRDVLVGRGDGQRPSGEPLQLGARGGLLAGPALHQDPRDPSPQAGEPLQARQRRHGHVRLRERPECFRAEHRGDAQSIGAPAQLQRHHGTFRRQRAGGRGRAGDRSPAGGRGRA